MVSYLTTKTVVHYGPHSSFEPKMLTRAHTDHCTGTHTAHTQLSLWPKQLSLGPTQLTRAHKYHWDTHSPLGLTALTGAHTAD